MASKYALEATFNLIDKITKPLEKVEGQGKIVSNSLKTAFAKAQSAADKFGGALGKVGGALKSAIGIYAAVNLNKVASFMTSGVQGAMELSDTFAKMSTSVDTSVYSMKELQKQITAIANAEGQDVNIMAKIQMDAIGTGGIDPAKSAEFAMVLKKVSDVAGTDTHTAMTDLTSVMGAFGMQAEEGAKLAGQMLLVTQKFGRNITFEQMAKGMKSVMPEAAALNITTGEMFSSFATLTSMGEDSTKAMKGLGSMFTKIQKPSKAAAELAQNLGIEFNAAALKSKGLAGFIADVTAKTGGNTELLTRLFEDVDLARMMRKLGVEGAAAFTDGLSQMQDGAAALEEFHDKSQDSIAERWNKAINRMKNVGVTLGAAFMPVLEKIVDKIGAVTAAFTSVDTSKLEAAMNSVGAAVGFVIDRFISVVKIAWQFRGVIIAAAGAIVFFTAVMKGIEIGTRLYNIVTSLATGFQIAYGIVIQKNAAATAALTFATKGAQTATSAWMVVMKIGTAIQNGFVKAINAIRNGTLAAAAAQGVQAAATGIATAAQWAFNIAAAANPIGLIIMGIVAAIAAVIGIIVLLRKHWEKITEAVKKHVNKIMAVLTILLGPFGLIISVIKELIANWGKVKEALSGTGLMDAIKNIGASIKAIFQPAIDWVVNAWRSAVSFITGLFQKIGGFFSSIFGPVITGISNLWQGISGAITGAFAKIGSAISGFLMPIFNWLGETWLKIVGFFENNAIGKAIKTIGGIVISGLLAPIQGLLELIALIPGIGKIADTGAQKIEELRNGLKGIDNATAKAEAASGSAAQAAATPSGLTAPEVPELEVPGISMPGIPDMTAAGGGGKSPLHGVVDISNGAASVPVIQSLNDAAFPAAAPAAISPPPQSETVTALLDLTSVVRHIDASVSSILAISNRPLSIQVPELAAVAQALRTASAPAGTGLALGAGGSRTATSESPQSAAPVSREERMAYSLQERRDTARIEVAAAQGTSARITRRPRSANISLVSSGGNA
jgi:TP901 family phage tail tape measure protein